MVNTLFQLVLCRTCDIQVVPPQEQSGHSVLRFHMPAGRAISGDKQILKTNDRTEELKCRKRGVTLRKHAKGLSC